MWSTNSSSSAERIAKKDRQIATLTVGAESWAERSCLIETTSSVRGDSEPFVSSLCRVSDFKAAMLVFRFSCSSFQP